MRRKQGRLAPAPRSGTLSPTPLRRVFDPFETLLERADCSSQKQGSRRRGIAPFKVRRDVCAEKTSGGCRSSRMEGVRRLCEDCFRCKRNFRQSEATGDANVRSRISTPMVQRGGPGEKSTIFSPGGFAPLSTRESGPQAAIRCCLSASAHSTSRCMAYLQFAGQANESAAT